MNISDFSTAQLVNELERREDNLGKSFLNKLKRQRKFTTGQVARICDVTPQTAAKWIDSGELKGYRIPGGNDRRVSRASLITFLKKHGMPLRGLDDPHGVNGSDTAAAEPVEPAEAVSHSPML